MKYELNPDLPVLEAKRSNWPGNPIEGKEFQYEQQPFRPQWSKVLRMMVSPNPLRAAKKADPWVPAVSQDTGYLEDRERDFVVWLGHACFLLQLGGRRYLTDPQLGDMPLVPRRVYPPFRVEEMRGIDYLCLSHDHRDHVDEHCIRTLCANNDVRKIYAPLRLSNVIADWVGTTAIEEAGWYQTYRTEAGLRLHFLPSRHWCRRGLTDFNRTLWGSFMFERLGGGEGAPYRIYFGGDSAETAYWAEIGALFPGIDIAMLGIGAYLPEYMMRENHANPEEAFGGYRDLGAHYWWPMHHGTYDLSNEPPSQPILRATQAMSRAGRSDRLLQPPINAPFYLDRD